MAEDDATIREVMGAMLQRLKYAVDFAEDGEQAVAMWEQGSYDVILMDVQMPRLDGFEATGAIRERELASGGRTPIIAMTAHAMKKDEKRCIAAGMDAYLSKPIDFKSCLAKIRQLTAVPPPENRVSRGGAEVTGENPETGVAPETLRRQEPASPPQR